MTDKTKVTGEGHYDGDDYAFHDELGSFNNEPPPGRVISAASAERMVQAIKSPAMNNPLPENTPIAADTGESVGVDQNKADKS